MRTPTNDAQKEEDVCSTVFRKACDGSVLRAWTGVKSPFLIRRFKFLFRIRVPSFEPVGVVRIPGQAGSAGGDRGDRKRGRSEARQRRVVLRILKAVLEAAC